MDGDVKGGRPTGIDLVGAAPWGTHFCQFYAGKQDLTDILVPYFQAGLQNDEFCMWVTAPSLTADEAWQALAQAVPDLESYRRQGRIEIIPHTEWYLAGGHFDQQRVLQAWVHKLEAALARGCAGLRLSGDTFWLEQSDWKSFAEYEANIDRVIGQYKMLALCTYALERCGAAEIADVIKNHQFALLKRNGAWELFESFDRREMQRSLAREVEELRRTQEALRANEQRLRQIDERKNEFLAVLSHELRNPLAPIKISLYTLDRAAPGSAQAARAKAVIERQVNQLSRLVDDLLDVTRISREKIRLQMQQVDVNRLVERAVEDHRAIFEKSGVHLHLALSEGGPHVMGDSARLMQVVGNLLQNAAKFTPPGGSAFVSVATERPARQVVIRVADNGVGMNAESMSSLFEPFMQAAATLDRSKSGLGIGLALVKGMVELHGGRVDAHSDGPGQGAVFEVRLPLGLGPEKRGPDLSRATTARQHRILIIEDNHDAAESLREVLEISGHAVLVAHDGHEGLMRARESHPDLIICDIGLPGMDGFQVARAVREDNALKGTLLVALSGYAQPEDLERAHEAGFNHHLAKPPSLEKLEEILSGL
jgi:signal transduction histidine kinase